MKHLILSIFTLAGVCFPFLVTATPLHDAVINGNIKELEVLISQGADINARGKFSGMTPLHFAANKGNKEIVKFLLSKGADVNAKDAIGLFSVQAAIFAGHKDIVYILRQHKGIPKPLTKSQATTLLHDVTITGNFYQVERLINHGANIQHKDKYGNTALHVAAILCHKKLVKLFLDNGADVKDRNKKGFTPLHGLAPVIASLLIKQEKEDPSIKTALSDYKHIIRILIEKGADINATDNNGATLLHLSAELGSEGAAKLLLDNGADVNAKDSKGQTALHIVAVLDHISLAELLISRGADVNVRNNYGLTPLYGTFIPGNKDMADLLRRYGAREHQP